MKTLRQQPRQRTRQARIAPAGVAITRQKIILDHPKTQRHEHQAKQARAQKRAPQQAPPVRSFPGITSIHPTPPHKTDSDNIFVTTKSLDRHIVCIISVRHKSA
jgi:hypothetical protein